MKSVLINFKHRLRTLAIGTALVVLPVICAFAQSPSTPVQVSIPITMETIRTYGCCDDWVDILGTIRLLIHPARDENGCRLYRIECSLNDIIVYGWSGITFSMRQRAPEPTEICFCDEETCIAQGILTGSFTVHAEGINPQYPCEMLFEYSIPFTWNRCTGEFSAPTNYTNITGWHCILDHEQ